MADTETALALGLEGLGLAAKGVAGGALYRPGMSDSEDNPIMAGSLGSSCVSSYQYNKTKQTLELTYVGSDKAYTYEGVSRDEFMGLLHAASKGSYVNRVIKSHSFS